MEYFGSSEAFELYMIAALLLVILWLILNTFRFYKSEKRKVRHLHRFAKEGEADAQHSLAQRYHKGNAVKKNCQKAAFWYQKAAFSGKDDAKFFLDKIRKKKRC